jgi:hypothetical protein
MNCDWLPGKGAACCAPTSARRFDGIRSSGWADFFSRHLLFSGGAD